MIGDRRNLALTELVGSQQFRSRDQYIVLGNALPAITAEMASRGWSTGFIIASRSTAENGILDRVRTAASAVGLTIREHVGITPHSPAHESEQIAKLMRDDPPDVLIAVGGGKVSDAAKAVSLLCSNAGPLESLCTVFTPPDGYWTPPDVVSRIPILAVPTTLSGAELTPGGGARTPTGEKRAFWAPDAPCRMAAYDFEIIELTPVSVLAGTGMNALAHCIEGSYSRTRSAITDALARSGASRLIAGLADLSTSGPEGETLSALVEGAVLGGLVISNARTGLHHAICHVLGARFGVAHGDANAVMLPAVIRFNAPVAGRELDELAESVLGSRSSSEDLAVRIEEIRKRLEVPTGLEDLGIRRDDLESVASAVMSERGLYFNPRRVQTADELLPILEASL